MSFRAISSKILRAPTASKLFYTPRYFSTSRISLVTKYAESHEWINVENGVGTVGITNHAQAQLGDVVYVEVPEVGAEIEAKSGVAVVESVKAASDIYSPVAGEVIEVNEALSSDPTLINTSAEAEGWLFKVKLSNEAELEGLLDAEAYKKLSDH
ncbi:hypothetical protein CONCODRAFT_19362 [Conidiobolus coronatus NRRL 28638]|uniref:Glycine cleavage system H protein n=1 Tax=Conidiobolus coronatus (strain ATCC 28846 / CBS 209.66 / NRRL 28638) TaxID=796925 RepID=A0A137NYD0_CONC2|nr:hypothetical protein CONCODRAFT_19362 [Conidiobolus coronatus NRRL 28638]|eukprot:KXN67786.1 hypothetical protein CONCODRAFT_19362 [Conidiobolus coronatus NRRL 28638]